MVEASEEFSSRSKMEILYQIRLITWYKTRLYRPQKTDRTGIRIFTYPSHY